jgi:hypothetical protein
MFVLWVLYSKDKKGKSQDNQDREEWIKYIDKTKKIPVETRFSTTVHTDPGAHPASYTIGTGSLSRG